MNYKSELTEFEARQYKWRVMHRKWDEESQRDDWFFAEPAFESFEKCVEWLRENPEIGNDARVIPPL